LLALSHGLLAIGLVLTASAATGRASAATTSAILAIPLIHIAIVISAETLVQLNPRLVIVVCVAILIEFAAALFLIWRRNANFPKIRAFAEDAVALAR
jgi:lipopolysaccharide export system permease protein